MKLSQIQKRHSQPVVQLKVQMWMRMLRKKMKKDNQNENKPSALIHPKIQAYWIAIYHLYSIACVSRCFCNCDTSFNLFFNSLSSTLSGQYFINARCEI